MKAIFTEALLVVASSLLWIFVLPFAAVIQAGTLLRPRFGYKAAVDQLSIVSSEDSSRGLPSWVAGG
jgi:hypothetical protein